LQEIHQRLDHPVVDGYAHWLESVPVFHDQVKATGGHDLFSHHLYFGCESDDPTVRWAFDDRATMGARFQPISARRTRPST
jgi:hypothetical protein